MDRVSRFAQREVGASVVLEDICLFYSLEWLEIGTDSEVDSIGGSKFPLLIRDGTAECLNDEIVRKSDS